MSAAPRRAHVRVPAPDDEAARARQARRREATRRRRQRELDVAVGIVIGVVALIVAPGLGYVAIVGVPVLLVCGVSLARQRRRSRRARR